MNFLASLIKINSVPRRILLRTVRQNKKTSLRPGRNKRARFASGFCDRASAQLIARAMRESFDESTSAKRAPADGRSTSTAKHYAANVTERRDESAIFPTCSRRRESTGSLSRSRARDNRSRWTMFNSRAPFREARRRAIIDVRQSKDLSFPIARVAVRLRESALTIRRRRDVARSTASAGSTSRTCSRA